MTQPPPKWRLSRWLLGRVVASAARRVLVDRALTDVHGNRVRWLRPEIEGFIDAVEADAAALRPGARLEELPGLGNRLMVELAVYTSACDRVLRREGIAPESAHDALSDLGWDVYRRMLWLASLPARLLTRDPGRRLRWTIRMLMVFPFRAPGAPGYAVSAWTEGGDLFTHWTHCPPQSYVRRLSEETGDPDALAAFRSSWCRYDWAGADLIAGDGQRGHYTRSRTLSHGDPVCDMCWRAHAAGVAREGPSTDGDAVG